MATILEFNPTHIENAGSAHCPGSENNVREEVQDSVSGNKVTFLGVVDNIVGPQETDVHLDGYLACLANLVRHGEMSLARAHEYERNARTASLANELTEGLDDFDKAYCYNLISIGAMSLQEACANMGKNEEEIVEDMHRYMFSLPEEPAPDWLALDLQGKLGDDGKPHKASIGYPLFKAGA